MNQPQKNENRKIISRVFSQRSELNISIIVFSGISFLMLWTNSRFEKELFYSKIQFGLSESHETFKVQRELFFDKFDFENLYFFPDMVFMLSICWVFSVIARKLHKYRAKRYINYQYFKVGFGITALASIAFDIYENCLYLGVNFPYRPGVESLKIGAIIALFLLFIVYCFLHFFDIGIRDNVKVLPEKSLKWEPKKVVNILKASSISIFLLFVMALGLTFLDQGATLVVHLIDSASQMSGKIQIVMTVILLNQLAVVLSHYPEYLQFFIEGNKNTRWDINWKYKYIPGLITFTTKHFSNTEEEEGEQKYATIETLIRYMLGIFTYIAWFYVVYKAFDLYGLTGFSAGPSVFVWSVLVCMIIFYLYRIHGQNSCDLLDAITALKKLNPERKDHKFTITKDAIDQVRPWINGYLGLFLTSLIVGLLALFVYASFGWHRYSFIITIAFLLVNTFLYVFFRLTRTYSKYVWFDAKDVKRMLKKDSEVVFVEDCVDLTIENNAKPKFYHKLLGFVSCNYDFLKSIWVATLLSTIYLISSFLIMDENITEYSTIPMLLSFMLVIYIVIIYPIKLYLAYGKRRYDELEGEHDSFYKRRKKFIGGLFAAGVLLFTLFSIGKMDNLHKLYYVDSNDNISIENFEDDLEKYVGKHFMNETKKCPMLQVSSFGGGLKSNLWTLLVMNELNDTIKSIQEDRNVLDYIISMSGVSGGALGLSNFMVLDYMDRINDDYDRANIIDSIGRENILSIDASGVFGHDRLAQIISRSSSKNDPNKDRSYYAMRRYMKILTDGNLNELEKLNTTSLTEYWKQMKGTSDHLPALIINTASTGVQPGVAYSLESDDIIFPGYIQLSDTTNLNNGKYMYKDLRYYDAVSTSNRFPIMSPTAQIEEEGFFLDGGYFENSGLLTTSHFLKEVITSKPDLARLPLGNVVIINSKGDYIRQFIKNNDIKLVEIDKSTNSAAIIKGITNIDKLPNVLLETEETYRKTGDSLFTILLPHLITIDDIASVIGGDFSVTNAIWDAIDSNNYMIDTALLRAGIDIKYEGIVVPPLARTLSDPAVNYEKAMIKYHWQVRSELKSVISYITSCEAIEIEIPRDSIYKPTEQSDKYQKPPIIKMQPPAKVLRKAPKKKVNASAQRSILKRYQKLNSKSN